MVSFGCGLVSFGGFRWGFVFLLVPGVSSRPVLLSVALRSTGVRIDRGLAWAGSAGVGTLLGVGRREVGMLPYTPTTHHPLGTPPPDLHAPC